MTAYEIHDYISMEDATHGNIFTKVSFHNGDVLMGSLFAADQIIEDSLKSNIWNYRAIDGNTILKINGDDILHLKVG